MEIKTWKKQSEFDALELFYKLSLITLQKNIESLLKNKMNYDTKIIQTKEIDWKSKNSEWDIESQK